MRSPWVAAVLLGLAAACRPAPPLRVGFVAGLSGRNSDLGVSCRNGAQLGLAELNGGGGIGGRPLELLVQDDAQDPETARRAVEQLIDAGVVAIIGHSTSSMAEATLPIVNRRRVLMVSPTVSASQFRGLDDWLVLLYPSTKESAASLASFLGRTRAGRQMAVIYDLSNQVFTASWAEHFGTALAATGGRVLRTTTFRSGEVPSYEALVASALDPAADGLLVVANALDTAAIFQQVRKRSSAVRLFGSDWGATPDVLAHGGAAVEGAVFTQKVDLSDTSPRFLRFRSAYEERFRRPVDFAAVMAYEAAGVLGEALRRDSTREGVRRELLRLGAVDGLQGPIQIDENGDARREHRVMVVRDGRLVRAE